MRNCDIKIEKVLIIILNWNGLKDTIECLESVYKIDYPNFEVILIDNFSSDNSPDIIKDHFHQLNIIKNITNLGFTGGNNIGIKYALENNADYVWLLNNDTIVEPQSLTKLVEIAKSDTDIGLVSPMIYDYDDRLSMQFNGCYIDYKNFSLIPVMNSDEIFGISKTSDLILYGTALLIKIKVIETIGCLNEKYFAYVEDCDFSVRALRADFRTAISVDSVIYHKGVQSTGKYSQMHSYLGTRNLYFFWIDNTRGIRKILVPFNYGSMVIKYAKCIKDGGNDKSVDACLNGFWAAVKGISGEYDQNIVAPKLIKIIFKFFISWHPYFWSVLVKLDFRTVFREISVRIKI